MLTDKERKKIVADALKKAELENILATKTWEFSVPIDSESLKIYKQLSESGAVRVVGDAIRLIDGGINQQADLAFAMLIYERDEWKRRAAAHGCNIDGSDPDCG